MLFAILVEFVMYCKVYLVGILYFIYGNGNTDNHYPIITFVLEYERLSYVVSTNFSILAKNKHFASLVVRGPSRRKLSQF